MDMHLPTNTNHLVNFVDNKISVNGTVNALKGSKVGGNLYFVSPKGMIVGKTGVINAGMDAFYKFVTIAKIWENRIKKQDISKELPE